MVEEIRGNSPAPRRDFQGRLSPLSLEAKGSKMAESCVRRITLRNHVLSMQPLSMRIRWVNLKTKWNRHGFENHVQHTPMLMICRPQKGACDVDPPNQLHACKMPESIGIPFEIQAKTVTATTIWRNEMSYIDSMDNLYNPKKHGCSRLQHCGAFELRILLLKLLQHCFCNSKIHQVPGAGSWTHPLVAPSDDRERMNAPARISQKSCKSSTESDVMWCHK